MRSLKKTLQDNDLALLPVLAGRWDVDIKNLQTPAIIDALEKAMLDPARAEKIWETLNEDQRGTLQALISSGGKMLASMFTRMFGEIRTMGAAQIEREKPHLQPASSAEALFYRGLIAQAYEQADAGARAMIYVPDDLKQILPLHKTSYDDLEDAPLEQHVTVEALEEVTNAKQADTSLVDDMTSLLAYLQLHAPTLEGGQFSPAHQEVLLSYMLTPGEIRLNFLLALGVSADLIVIDEGKAHTKRAEIRRWLSEKRAQQVQDLAEAWRNSLSYRELWHVSGLHPEPTGWQYDPVVARGAMINFVGEMAPESDWWSLDAFIEAIKHTDPDFQRPGGDYSSWYIRNDEGDYLQGFESWDAVEGALLEFYITGPMHWLGLVDLADEAARLTAYGRAFLEIIPWPAPQEAEDNVNVQADGTLLVSRRVSRLDRFQVARFTTWGASGDPYHYKIDAAAMSQATKQGINAGHITTFITRSLGDKPIPPTIKRLLEGWQSGPATHVTVEQVLVLRTTAPETLNLLLDTPALRRYLGAQLGPMAVIVRPGQWEALREALAEAGIEAELIQP